MNNILKTFSIESETLKNKKFGKFYVRLNGDDYCIYNNKYNLVGKYKDKDVSEKVAESMAYKRVETLNYRLNGICNEQLSELKGAQNFIEKNRGCMIGGFFIVDGRPCKKEWYLAYDDDVQIIYSSFEQAFADLIAIHQVKDFKVVVS
jgi:hypothetical protein